MKLSKSTAVAVIGQLWVLVALFSVGAAPLFSQSLSWPPAEGARIRVTWLGPPRAGVIGEVAGVTGDTLRFIPLGDTRPTSAVLGILKSVEVSQKTRSHALQGALLGGLVAGLGFFGLAAQSPGQDQGVGFAAVVGVAAGLLGAGAGALIGSLSHTDVWVPLHLPPSSGRPGTASPVFLRCPDVA